MNVIAIDRHPSRRRLRRFGVVWLVFLAALGAMAWFERDNHRLAVGLWVVAVVVPVLGWCLPRMMRWLYVGLSYLTWPIGWLVSHLVLALVYFLVVTPIGLLARLFGYDPMSRKADADASSYWIDRPAAPAEPRRHFRQF